jgi:hypothetical protein
MKMERIICERCGCELEEDEAYFVEDDILCEECLEQNTVTCDHCGERLYVSDAVLDDDTTLCQRCFDDLYAMASLQSMDIVGHVHDEVIVECDREVSVEEVCRRMEKTPDWADDLLLRADGYECDFYMKQ